MSTPWYRNTIIYGIDIRTFMDSNGDGIGDLRGLISRLDYLADLGVTCLWLLPFYPTPFRDNGYDVMDYYRVDPAVGTLDDFVALCEQAQARGIRLVIDLALNHTSDQHPWFQAAQRDPASRYHRYYVWSKSAHQVTEQQRTIFPGVEDDVWTYSRLAGKYYYHRFYHFEPELNGRNPHVRAEIRRVLDFWLTFGVAGFRVDAVAHLVENKGARAGERTTREYQLLNEFYGAVSRRRQDVFLMGEADVEPQELRHFFGEGDRLTLLLNFLLSQYLFLALASEDARHIEQLLAGLPDRPANAQWANFLRNLDELDMERLSQEQRELVYRAFAPEEAMKVYGRGLRRRLAPMLGGERRRMELAFSLLFSQPGSPIIIYGDEIGMGEDLSQPQRNAVRPPMQWSSEHNAGFSAAEPSKLIRPVIDSGQFAYRQVNVADQRADPGSLLNWMRQLISVRKRCPEIGAGRYHILKTGQQALLAQLYERGGAAVLLLHNLGGAECRAALDLSRYRQREARLLFGDEQPPLQAGGAQHVRLRPYGYCWYRLDKPGSAQATDG